MSQIREVNKENQQLDFYHQQQKLAWQQQNFWQEEASKQITWHEKFHETYSFKEQKHQWFLGGKLNISLNCLDRHLEKNAEKTALLWESEQGETQSFSYQELHKRVSQFAAILDQLGLKKGDIVTLYLPMIPELAISMLACARIGATHNVVFAGFSSEALSKRNNLAEASLLITADFTYRNGKKINLLETVDESLKDSKSLEQLIIVNRSQKELVLKNKPTNLKTYDWHKLTKDLPNRLKEAEPLDSEHPLFTLFTSGSTGTPKGLVHTTAGYLLQAILSLKTVFGVKENDVFWTTADYGWITGHTYGLYAPLACGITTLMYEGGVSKPHWGRYWELIEKYQITQFYTAPTAIRACMANAPKLASDYDLSSLKVIGSVGEPINSEAWHWYRDEIGGGRCPLVDTWWQTETGSIMLSPIPKNKQDKASSQGRALPGIKLAVLDEQGNKLTAGKRGQLVITEPQPSMARTILKDHPRYLRHYYKGSEKTYYTGDGAYLDQDGDFWVTGRLDDVVNVAGHRLSTAELESILCSYPNIAEAACIGIADHLTGQALVCFVSLKKKENSDNLNVAMLKDYCKKAIGSFACPKEIYITSSLPKTRSGKIMRRLLRDIALSKTLSGDLSTLENRDFLKDISKLKSI